MADMEIAAEGRRGGVGSTPRRSLALLVAAAIGAAIFLLDWLTPLQGAVAVLYIVPILLVAQGGRRNAILWSAAAATLLATAAFLGNHFAGPVDGAYSRFGVSLLAIGLTTLLSLRDRSARTTLAEQARMLELTHDTVIIRDDRDVIVYWNDGAEVLYGWKRAEALGCLCNALLKSSYPTEDAAAALAEDGQWSGEIARTRRDGSRLILASRWLLRRDIEGRPIGIIETSADLTEQRLADAERQYSEQRYAAMFNAAGFVMVESDWSAAVGKIMAEAGGESDLRAWMAANPDRVLAAAGVTIIRDVNPATVELFGVPREEAIGKNIGRLFRVGHERPFAAALACRDALAANAEAWRLAQRRYSVGVADYQSVLIAEDRMLSSQRVVAALESRRFILDLALVRALGGGWRADDA